MKEEKKNKIKNILGWIVAMIEAIVMGIDKF